MSDEIRIYVADLAAYNTGYLHGVWIDACDDIGDIWEQIKTMLAASPVENSEERAIHDYEGFGGYALSEYEGIEITYKIACFIAEYPDFGGELLNHFDGDLEETKTAAGEKYCGRYQSLANYAQELTEETTQIPENLTYYIDYERMETYVASGNLVFVAKQSTSKVNTSLEKRLQAYAKSRLASSSARRTRWLPFSNPVRFISLLRNGPPQSSSTILCQSTPMTTFEAKRTRSCIWASGEIHVAYGANTG